MAESIPLKTLGLEKRWPRLSELGDEVAGLEKRLQESAAEVQRLQGQIGPAREKDLDLEAKALRADKKPPAPRHEPEIKGKLQGAERDRDVLARALESARADLGAFLERHRAELFEDIAAARGEIASRIAESARAALVAFAKHEDLHYVLKRLRPPVPENRENEPARSTTAFLGFGTTQQASGPARGEVEQILAYLVSLQAGEGAGAHDAA